MWLMSPPATLWAIWRDRCWFAVTQIVAEFPRTIDRVWWKVRDWLGRPWSHKFVLAGILSVHAALLAYSATCHSPTMLEPAQLASGLANWQLERFEAYRVNPPLVRMVAAIPVLIMGCETNWQRYYDGPGARAEFFLGRDFIRANGERSILLFIAARWACIPFSVLGAYFAYRWAFELYGAAAGIRASAHSGVFAKDG